MKKLSIAIIGPDTTNTHDLIYEAQEMGFIAKRYAIKDISFSTDKLGHDDFFQHDIYFFRGYNKSVVFAQTIAKYLQSRNKVVIDHVLSHSYIAGKLHEAMQFRAHGIPHPSVVYARSIDGWRRVLARLRTPIIIKPENAQKGQGIVKCDSIEDALHFLETNPAGFLAQEYIPLTFDIRVFIVGDTVLGAIKRNVVAGDFRTNASLGSVVELYELSDKEKDLALRSHRCMGYDISGVDLVKSGEDTFVLEVNIAPQWEAFRRTTGINVAKEIINYAVKKYEKDWIS